MGMNKNRTRKSSAQEVMCTQTSSCVLVSAFSLGIHIVFTPEWQGGTENPTNQLPPPPANERREEVGEELLLEYQALSLAILWKIDKSILKDVYYKNF